MIENLLQLAGVVIALVSALVSIIYSRQAQKSASKQLRLEYYRDLRQWTDEVIQTMSEAIFLCNLGPEQLNHKDFSLKQNDLRQRLSALIDRGRWFVPAKENGEGLIGIEEATMPGFKQGGLSEVVKAFDLVKGLTPGNPATNNAVKKELISNKYSFLKGWAQGQHHKLVKDEEY